MNINIPLDPRLCPPDGTRQPPPPSHPSEGGKAYSDDLRRQVLQMHFNNYDLREAPELVALRAARKFPSRWIQIFNQTGDICPLRHTGNHHAEREVQGLALKQLALYRCVFPKATIAECRAYLFNVDPINEPFSSSQVHRAEKFLGLKRKAASTTADLAFLPWNMALREYYWTHPPPLGMRGVPIADIIDINEAGFFLEHSDRKFGKTILSLRCSQNGVYGHGEKVNFLLVICGHYVGQMHWHTNNGWREARQLKKSTISLIILLMIWMRIIQVGHLCSPWTI